MKKIFISYSRKDEEFARRLAGSLTESGATVWIDVKNIRAGDNWSTAIQNALDDNDLLVLIISPDSMESGMVQNEWQYMLDKKKPVLPILWRPGGKTHFEIHRLQYVNFHKLTYETAYARLWAEIEAVKVTGAAPEVAAPEAAVPAPAAPKPVASGAKAERDARYDWRGAGSRLRQWWGVRSRAYRLTAFGVLVGVITLCLLGLALLLNGAGNEDVDPTLSPTPEPITGVDLGLAHLPGCNVTAAGIREDLGTDLPATISLIDTPVDSREDALATGHALVLWGGCPDDPDQLALHVDLRQKFGPDEVLGDDSYAIDLSTADRNRPVILARAFVNLLDGATLDAAASLSGFVTNAWRGQAPDERDPQVSALALLAANCFLFAEEYEDAIAAYDVLLGADADGNVDDEALDAALKADRYVAMALHNRGLAHANAWAAILNAAYQSSTGRELDDFAGAALADFDRLGEVVSEGDPTAATVLAPALSQHGIVFGWVESSADSDFEEYFDRCDDAMALAPDLALGYICWASLQYWKTDLQGGDGEGTDLALAHLDTAAGLAVSPPEIAYWRGQLYYQLADSQENPTDQADYYARGDESLIDFMRASQTEPVLLGLDHEMRRFAGNSVEGWAD